MEWGFVKTPRMIKTHPIFRKPTTAHLFNYCLLTANYKPQRLLYNGELYIIGAGEFTATLSEISKETGIKRSTVNRGLTTLCNTGLISKRPLVSQEKGKKRNASGTITKQPMTVISVMNWDTYQGIAVGSETGKHEKRNASGTIPPAKPLPVRDSDGNKKERIKNKEYIGTKESLSTYLRTHNLPVKLTEPVLLFTNKVRQSNTTKRVASSRIDKITEELVKVSAQYGEGLLVEAIERVLKKEDYRWESKNVTGYVKAIAKNLYEQNSQVQVAEKATVEKKMLAEAGSSRVFEEIQQMCDEKLQ